MRECTLAELREFVAARELDSGVATMCEPPVTYWQTREDAPCIVAKLVWRAEGYADPALNGPERYYIAE